MAVLAGRAPHPGVKREPLLQERSRRPGRSHVVTNDVQGSDLGLRTAKGLVPEIEPPAQTGLVVVRR